MSSQDKLQRSILPVPGVRHHGLRTYDPQDPDTKYQPIREFRPPKGGMVRLYVDGKKAGEGRVDQTEPFIFSADETLDVGNEFGSPVTPDYPAPKKFSGEVNWVEIDGDEDAEDLDHLITSEERLAVAMAIK